MTVEVSPKEIRFPSDPRMPRRCLQRAGEPVDRQNSLTSNLSVAGAGTAWINTCPPLDYVGHSDRAFYDRGVVSLVLWSLNSPAPPSVPLLEFAQFFFNVVHFRFSKCNPGFFLLFRKELTAAECACVNVSGQYGVVHNGQLVGCSFLGGVFLLTHLHVECRINLSQETILN